MSLLLTLAIVLYSASAALLGVLAFVYGRTALATRAKYPTGLLVFAILLLFQTLGTAGAYLFLSSYFLDEAVPAMALMAFFELVGVLALLRITL